MNWSLFIDPLPIRVRVGFGGAVSASALAALILLALGLELLQALPLLLRQRGRLLEIAVAVEERLAGDERRLHARVSREGMACPDGEVGVLAGVDRAEAVVEAELFGGVQRAEL